MRNIHRWSCTTRGVSSPIYSRPVPRVEQHSARHNGDPNRRDGSALHTSSIHLPIYRDVALGRIRGSNERSQGQGNLSFQRLTQYKAPAYRRCLGFPFEPPDPKGKAHPRPLKRQLFGHVVLNVAEPLRHGRPSLNSPAPAIPKHCVLQS